MAYKGLLKEIPVDGTTYKYFDLTALNDSRYDELPISIRYLLEAAVRHCDGFHVLESDVETILNWKQSQKAQSEIPFKPARVILQDFTGVPAVVDLAAMRDAVQNMGADPSRINPVCPVDLVIDHSIQVDHYGDSPTTFANAYTLKGSVLSEATFSHNVKMCAWGSKSFDNLRIVPPGVGIVHQVNLEYLSRTVFVSEDNVLYPDSVVGTDSHTTMVDGSGVLGWGVGGIEAEAVMLGQPISMVIPEVVGYELVGSLPDTVTSTDLVLTITKNLREIGVVGKFVEFFGEGVTSLSIADRATIANMCPEYGATVGFFPVDRRTVDYLRQTGRDEHYCKRVESYLKANKMFVEYGNPKYKTAYTQVLTLDMSTIVPSVSGPKRPQDRINLSLLHDDFNNNLTAKPSFKAVELGLCTQPYTKTSLSPGSRVVTKYLEASGLLPYLQKLGFHIAGYGCMTCIGNSGPLDEDVSKAIEQDNLVVAGVLSGNRNFEGRIHALVRANYLASPPLAVAYSIIGNVNKDISGVIAKTPDGKDVYFKDIWPTRKEVAKFEEEFVKPQFFKEVYDNIGKGSEQWQKLEVPPVKLYPWDAKSTYIKRVPFFENMEAQKEKIRTEDAKIDEMGIGRRKKNAELSANKER
ncbi:hypothetical protein Y032_0029g1889 [Ancylostoma ceylanicum]|uniref:aconitate hydratase n=1 Tax=Ancylostoma ceylanicum TaxID=53326 RepID=A0A016UQY3_9BILA|nr:hypothetical protein Y032_0029g1889 [Ancylostoma ceylanicum]